MSLLKKLLGTAAAGSCLFLGACTTAPQTGYWVDGVPYENFDNLPDGVVVYYWPDKDQWHHFRGDCDNARRYPDDFAPDEELPQGYDQSGEDWRKFEDPTCPSCARMGIADND